MTSNLFTCVVLMLCLTAEKVMCASTQGHFPLKGCSKNDMDVLSLVDDDDGMEHSVLISQMGFGLRGKKLSSANSSKWMVATVFDQFSAHNETINASHWSFHENVATWSSPNTVPKTNVLQVPIRDIRSRLELKIQIIERLFGEMSGVRNNAVHVGVVFLNGKSVTQEEIRNVPSIVQKFSSKVKIFTVIFGSKIVEEVVHLTDTLVLRDDYIGYFTKYLSMAMCETCGSSSVFKHTTGRSMLSSYGISTYIQEATWSETLENCKYNFGGHMAVIETAEEMLFLQEQLLKQFKDVNLPNISFHIGLTRDLGNYGKRFQWMNSLGQIRPLVIDHWLPGQPCRVCKNHDCVVWQFTNTTTRDKDNNSVSEGWMNINCHSKINSKELCEAVLPRKTDEADFVFSVPVPTNITDFAKEKEPFLIFDSNIVSLSANVPNPKFLQFLKDSNLDFPIFDCGEDVGDRRYLSYKMVCDFVDHCSNKRDELLCWNLGEFLENGVFCASGQKLLSEEYICDNIKHCRDGSDEENCFNEDCTSVRCQDGSCLPLQWVNDGHLDCFLYMTSSSECTVSDESFHENLPQLNNKSCVFSCNRNMCIEESQLNDSIKDCKGPEGRLANTFWKLEPSNTCRNRFGHFIWAPKCHYIKDRYGGVVGCRDMSHLRDCENFQCGQGYVKCYNSYCIPHYYLRDGRADCPTGEDEQLLYTGPCTGYFACWDSNICLHPDLVCDGHTDCPHSDDEIDCDVFCPKGFRCIAGTVIFSADRRSVPFDMDSLSRIDLQTKYLDLSGAEISHMTDLVFAISDVLYNMKVLILSNCTLSEFSDFFMREFMTEKLDISYNKFTICFIKDYSYQYPYLRFLNVSHNQLLKSVTNLEFSFLEVLDLSYTSLAYLKDSVFAKLPRLKYLNLSHTLISDFTRQYFSPALTLHVLDLRGILAQDIDDYLFYNLTISQTLYSDLFQICCPQIQGLIISPRACVAPIDTDAISSCANLLGIDIQRFLLWIVAILAVLGNVTVIVYRVIWDRSVLQTGYGLFVTNLGISDFIMGVYLLMIAAADSFYRDSYVLYDKTWRNSVECKAASFMAFLSCEASTFFIFLITLDRFLVMKFPFGQVKFKWSEKTIAVVMSWVASFLLSLVPIVFKFDIYSSNAMCLGLPLTNTYAKGWEYSVAVFIVFNLIMFVFVACGQYAIFRAMSKNRISKTATNMPSSRRAEDITVAKQLSLVVLSNFLFWFPVGIMGLMSLGGHEISSQVYAWTTVLLLPINSAANPVLYTIPALLERWQQFKRGV